MVKRILLALGCVVWASPAFAQRDAIDLSKAVVWNSPQNVASWAKTTRIEALTMRPSSDPEPGLSLYFPARATWPDYTPPGWDGPIQYTIWAGVRINGTWHVSGIIQMWRERAATGAPILTDFAINWVYDGRWGTMAHYQPVAGEAMVFFVTAGNARGVGTVTSVAQRSNVVMVNLPAGDYGNFNFSGVRPPANFDGDTKTDLTVFRPTTGQWITLKTENGYTTSSVQTFGGLPGDKPLDGDFDGDGRNDLAIFRPSNGAWFIRRSSDGVGLTYIMGGPGDIPVSGDFEGDGKSDLMLYRPSTGFWFIQTMNGAYYAISWGGAGDIPAPADFDGDGKTDLTIFRPSTGVWYVRLADGSPWYFLWGAAGDVPLSSDADGDGKADLLVYRPTVGTWYGRFSSYGYNLTGAYNLGAPGDIPLQGDFDGDQRGDIAVYRPATGQWIIRFSATNYATGTIMTWGTGGDDPLPRPPFDARVAVIPPGVSSGPVGSARTWNFQGAGGSGPYSYLVWVHDGTMWTLGQNWSSSSSFTWAPPKAGTFTFQVWMRNAQSQTTDAWAAFGPYVATAASPLDVTGIGLSGSFPRPAGSPVTLTASATGGSGPYTYKFLLYNGTTWVVARDWDASSSWTWTPGSAGNYIIQVWARNAGSSAVYDGWRSTGWLVVN